MAGTRALAHCPWVDRNRDPPGRDPWPASVHRPRHGRGDRRDGRHWRRLHALSRRHAGRHQLARGQAPPDAGGRRGRGRRRQDPRADHGGGRRTHWLQRRGGAFGATTRYCCGHPGTGLGRTHRRQRRLPALRGRHRNRRPAGALGTGARRPECRHRPANDAGAGRPASARRGHQRRPRSRHRL